MSREKNKNSALGGAYGSFQIKKFSWSRKKQLFASAILLLVLVSGTVVAIYNKFKSKPVELSQVSQDKPTDIPGWWYQQYFGKSVCENDLCKPGSDPDNDKLTNDQEFYYHSNPTNAYTIGDKLNDGQLVAQNIDPSKVEKITFDDAIGVDNIMSESLVFGSDIQQLINEQVDPNRVQLPTINDVQLKISDNNTREGIGAYLDASKKISDKYFSKDFATEIQQISAFPDPEGIARVQRLCLQARLEMMNLEVPSEFLQLHKYSLMMLELMPEVINVPDESNLQSEYDTVGNKWFDKAQALMVIYQKMDLESRRLLNKFR